MANFDVTAEKAFDGKGSDIVMILEFCSGKVMSFKSGKSANSSVFWNRDESSGNILIGDDDVTWDIGLTVENIPILRVNNY